MSKALVLMTALLPTTGHIDLIRFAKAVADEVTVIVSTRSFEPAIVSNRVAWIKEEVLKLRYPAWIEVFEHNCDEAPQNPEDHPDFWGWWKNAISNFDSGFTHVVASEPYGQKLAETLGCQFLPYDINRTINPVKSSYVRKNIDLAWLDIILEARKDLITPVTLFGQESVGKTTISQELNGGDPYWNYTIRPEYARAYLETVGPELTPEKMHNILLGQKGYQWDALEKAESHVVVFDTDLFSTVGYYRLSGTPEINPGECLTEAKLCKSELYFILPDDVPFEKDPLRYGGDKRESTTEFWINLAKEYGLNYKLVPTGTLESKVRFIKSEISQHQNRKFSKLRNFTRT